VYKVKPGNSKYVDVNKDGVYNDADQGIIGCGQPTFNWGWNNTFNYKNFDFSFFVVGFHGFDIYNATHQMGYNLIKSQQMAGVTPMRELLNRWTPTNTNTDIPGFVKGGTENKDFFSTRFVENGSFIKMKSITLGYTLPEATCRSLGINNLRVYASVQNIELDIALYAVIDCFVRVAGFPDVSHRIVCLATIEEAIVIFSFFVFGFDGTWKVHALLYQAIVFGNTGFACFTIVTVYIQTCFQPFLDFGIYL
jgi:hypothetical protein